MKLLHLIAGAGLAAGSLLIAPAAQAAVPANDTYDNRVFITSPTFTDSVDTTEATSDADDQAIRDECFGTTDASVWYSFTASAHGGFTVTATSADYLPGVAVVTGAPGSWDVLRCDAGEEVFEATAGTTYTLLVYDGQRDGGGNGGQVDITVEQDLPFPELDLTLDPRARFNADGSITLTGTMTCAGGPEMKLIASVEQAVGPRTIIGYTDPDMACPDGTRPWSLTVHPHNGIFKGGKASTDVRAYLCDTQNCTFDSADRPSVTVSGGRS